MKKRPQPNTPVFRRFPAVDLLRGIAIAMMIAYHFSFDLHYFGVIEADMNNDPFWLRWRALIVTLFLATVGMSLLLAHGREVKWRSFGRRLVLIAAAAAAVSIASGFAFPRSWIFFGVLHFIALATLLALPFVRLYWTNLVVGVALLVIGLTFSHPFFDQPLWQWFGLMTHKPITEDYVPLLPWFGVVLIGLFLGRAVFERNAVPALAAWKGSGATRTLTFAGRHGLVIYLVHQPVLLGAMWLAFG